MGCAHNAFFVFIKMLHILLNQYATNQQILLTTLNQHVVYRCITSFGHLSSNSLLNQRGLINDTLALIT